MRQLLCRKNIAPAAREPCAPASPAISFCKNGDVLRDVGAEPCPTRRSGGPGGEKRQPVLPEEAPEGGGRPGRVSFGETGLGEVPFQAQRGEEEEEEA